MPRALLSIGSNRGDRANFLQQAMIHLGKRAGNIIEKASIYETEAWGKTDQQAFLNTCVLVETELSALQLFKAAKAIEGLMKRSSKERWGPREIDIDIIFYEQEIMDTAQLKIPHQSMQERNFVLVPAMQICPEWMHPIYHKTVKELLEESADKLKTELWNP